MMQFIDGALRDAGGAQTHRVIDPSSGETITEFTPAGPAEVDLAVAAARTALVSISRIAP